MKIGINPSRMQVDDLEEVCRLDRSVFDFPWTLKNFKDSIDAGHGCFKWMLGADIVAYSVVSVVHDESHLLNIGVDPELRGRGLGGAVVDNAMTYAASRGARSMFLEVRSSNQAAIHLYENKGFVKVGTRPAYYPSKNGREDALLYAVSWDLFCERVAN